MIWILIWALVSLALIAVYLWSTGINLRQARAWKMFAEKHGLDFVQKGLLQPPAMIGSVSGYNSRLYMMIENDDVTRKKLIWTFLEVDLKSDSETEFVIAKHHYPSLFEGMREESKLDITDISVAMARALDADKANRFLSPERMAALRDFWAWEGYEPILLNNASACTMIAKTQLPLTHPRDVQDALKFMISLATRFDQGTEPGNVIPIPESTTQTPE